MSVTGRASEPVVFVVAVLALALAIGPAAAQNCKRTGDLVTCDDGRTGRFTGDAIVWPDGTRSSAVSPHPSVIIGNKPSVRVGPGVFVGKGDGSMVPLDDPNAPNKTRCAVLDGVSYVIDAAMCRLHAGKRVRLALRADGLTLAFGERHPAAADRRCPPVLP